MPFAICSAVVWQVRALDWRAAFVKKLEDGATLEDLKDERILFVCHGDCIREVSWGVVDRSVQAVLPGIHVRPSPS